MTLAALLCDLDGTLIDSEPLQLQAWNHALRPYGVAITEAAYVDYCGRSSFEICYEIITTHMVDCDIASLQAARKQFVEAQLATPGYPLPLMPGAEELLRWCVSMHLPRAIVTSSRFSLAWRKMQVTGLLPYCNKIVGADQVDHAKPAPDLYLKAADILAQGHGSLQGDIICIEDTPAGVAAAQAAGFTCLAVPNRFSRERDFKKADAIFPSLTHVLEWVQTRYSSEMCELSAS